MRRHRNAISSSNMYPVVSRPAETSWTFIVTGELWNDGVDHIGFSVADGKGSIDMGGKYKSHTIVGVVQSFDTSTVVLTFTPAGLRPCFVTSVTIGFNPPFTVVSGPVLASSTTYSFIPPGQVLFAAAGNTVVLTGYQDVQ